MKISFVSDLHADKNNLIKITTIFKKIKSSGVDYLFICGDISDDINITIELLNFVTSLFKVIFVPGNHDLELFEGLHLDISQICHKLNIKYLYNNTLKLNNNIIVFGTPLFYDGTFCGKNKPVVINELYMQKSIECKAALIKFIEDNSYKDQILIILTHYVPIKRVLEVYSVLADDSDKLLEGCDIYNDTIKEKLLSAKKVYWCYGHMHDNNVDIKEDNVELFNIAIGTNILFEKDLTKYYKIIEV